jgi:hypothetical protein
LRFSPVSAFKPPYHDVVNFEGKAPIVLKQYFNDFPAISRWFEPISPSSRDEGHQEPNYDYLGAYGSTIVPLELTRSMVSESAGQPLSTTFERFEAPIQLLLEYLKLEQQDLSTRLYLAQCPLENLHPEMKNDLPTPNILSRWGKGDVYGSSLWMGRPPTRTPLHRDPNPNIFVQLAGKKVVRLMQPDAGQELYMRARAGVGHANMRGEEMMVGEESDRLEEAVWRENALEEWHTQGWEATLERGDSLYIPLGWWHSVRGVGKGVNCSVSRPCMR